MNKLLISYKKSLVKLNGKTILFEIKNTLNGESENISYLFADRSLHRDILHNPHNVLEIIRKNEILSKEIDNALHVNAKISLTYKGFLKKKTYILNDPINSKKGYM